MEKENVVKGATVICPACNKHFTYSISNRIIYTIINTEKRKLYMISETLITLKCPHCKTIILPKL